MLRQYMAFQDTILEIKQVGGNNCALSSQTVRENNKIDSDQLEFQQHCMVQNELIIARHKIIDFTALT